MDMYGLPTSIEVEGKIFTFNADFRNILLIFRIFNDPNLLDVEKTALALENFYDDYEGLGELSEDGIIFAIKEMMTFLSAGDESESSSSAKAPLYNWDSDFNIIVAPINRIQGVDVRGLKFFHWWTFLSAFMEIGECTFSTYVSIRDKLNRGARLEKWEEKIYKEHRSKIQLKKQVDNTTQALMDEILGKGV